MRVRFYVRPSPGPPAVSHTMVSAFFNTVLCTRVFIVALYDSLVSRRNIVIMFSYSRVLAIIEVIILAEFRSTTTGEKTKIFDLLPYPVARKRHVAKSTSELFSAATRPNDQFLTHSYRLYHSYGSSYDYKQKFQDLAKLLPSILYILFKKTYNTEYDLKDNDSSI